MNEATAKEQREYCHYSMILEWDPVDRIFIVTIPELPGCRTHGRTYLEAVQQGQYALEGWVDAARAWGHSIPDAAHFDIECDSRIMHIASEELMEANAAQSTPVESRSA